MIRWKLINYHHILWTLIISCYLRQNITALTVDNQLVSARNDCFERVALEAMIPFEKTFKTEYTNSLNMCKEKCFQAGDKCQSISFGVHRRGNGTCQLSKEKYKTGSRPNGVIFDPDFDLYARKTNCFDLSDNNHIPDQSDNLEQTNGYGPDIAPTSPVLLNNGPSESTTIMLVEPTPIVRTNSQEDEPSTSYDEPSTIFTQGPPTTYEPSTQNIPSSSPSNGDRLYFSQDIYPLYKYPTLYEPNYPAPNQEVYIPGGYAANAEEVKDHFRPDGYDDNTRPSPPPNYHGPSKPVFGLGYGSGYSYSQPESYNPSTNRPQDSSGYSSNSQRPTNINRDPRPADYDNRDPMKLTNYGNNNRDRDPLRPSNYDNTTPSTSPYYHQPDNNQNFDRPYLPRPNNGHSSSPSHELRPEIAHSSPAPYEPPARPSSLQPGDFMDFTNRPDAPDETARPFIFGPSGDNSFDNNYMRRNGTAAVHPDGYSDDKHINTYFNPDDYLTSNKKRPAYYYPNGHLNYNRGPMRGKF